MVVAVAQSPQTNNKKKNFKRLSAASPFRPSQIHFFAHLLSFFMSSLMFFSFFRCPFRCLLLVNLNVILRVELVSLLMQLILVTLWPKVIRKYRMLDTHFCLALQAVFTSCTFNLFILFCHYFRDC